MRATASRRVGVRNVIVAVALVALVAIGASYYYIDSRSASSGVHLGQAIVIMPDGVGGNTSLNFQPTSIVVVIGVNNTVTWRNDDTQHDHTATATSGPTPTKAFDSGNMGGNAVFSFTFTIPGTYEYVCAFHSWMHGTVLVKQS